ncbi:unnamed protein product [Clavelina lepadiformis]|uniref:Fibrinogen C-terminal domain-containing protein n=1 Tax=Clavelina lepadiformis TaxID=159417 RepID=A0ABP0G0M0_CLALP
MKSLLILIISGCVAMTTAQCEPGSDKCKLPTSCQQIRDEHECVRNGIYWLRDRFNVPYTTYCDMEIDDGGWTLVATIHDNNPWIFGRCSTGDRWSSEDGNIDGSHVGAESWSNRVVFGNPQNAAGDDFKNPAYFELEGRDIMIWQVPNDTPLEDFNSAAYLKYRTTDGALEPYGGNLFNLYNDHFPIKTDEYTRPAGNGPALPIVFDKGNTAELLGHFGPIPQQYVEPGYIQFRAINHERSAFALCPGVKMGPLWGDVEHTCIGSTRDNAAVAYCGDLAGFAYDGYGNGLAYNTDKTLLETTFFIFYR